jgi:hypothetical protein
MNTSVAKSGWVNIQMDIVADSLVNYLNQPENFSTTVEWKKYVYLECNYVARN